MALSKSYYAAIEFNITRQRLHWFIAVPMYPPLCQQWTNADTLYLKGSSQRIEHLKWWRHSWMRVLASQASHERHRGLSNPIWIHSANTRYRPNVGPMLGHRLRRCPNIGPTFGRWLVCAGIVTLSASQGVLVLNPLPIRATKICDKIIIILTKKQTFILI